MSNYGSKKAQFVKALHDVLVLTDRSTAAVQAIIKLATVTMIVTRFGEGLTGESMLEAYAEGLERDPDAIQKAISNI